MTPPAGAGPEPTPDRPEGRSPDGGRRRDPSEEPGSAPDAAASSGGTASSSGTGGTASTGGTGPDAREGAGRSQRGPARPAALPEVPGYRIQGVLGRGSTGVVYRAIQLAVDRPVALKVLHPQVARGRVVRRLQREARTTARLQHPNIVTAIDMGSIDGVWWYAMELVEGPSLAARLRKEGPLTERAALRLFTPLCEALVHLAHQGVVHRDIKPANILVDSNGRARLVDLGLAFAEDDPSVTVQGGTLGTPHYVAPEQARDAGAADVRSDLWSLGATLYHAVTGRPPFLDEGTESVAEIISAVLYAPIPDPGELAPELSRGMRLVLRKCLTRAPERRYQTPEELLEDLERLRERRQVGVQRSSLDPVAGHDRRVRRAWLGAGLLVVAGLLALAWVTAPASWRARLGGGGVADDGGGPPELEEGSAAAELEELARLGGVPGEGDRRRLAPALARLEELRDELPPGFERRHAEVRADLMRRYNDAAQKLRAGFQRDLNQALERRDYVAAAALTEGGVEVLLERELAPTPAQRDALLELFEVPARRREVELVAERALVIVEERLREHYRSRVLTAVADLASQLSWRSARSALRVPAVTRLEQAGIDTAGLPAARVRAVIEAVHQALTGPALAELEEAWIAFDREQAEWIDLRADELAQALDDRSETEVAEHLREDWSEHRRELGLEQDELLPELSDLARDELDDSVRELTVLEERFLREDADRIVTERIERAEPKWGAREYDQLVELWSTAAGMAYLEPERRRLRGLLVEAELLEELLQRAARGLAELPTDRPVLLRVGSIGVEGLLSPGPDPLREPFLLRPTAADGGTELRLSLRARPGAQPLSTQDVERLAGLADATGGRERLMRALFRWREGDVAAAAGLLPLPALVDPELDLLATELVRRVGRSLEARELGREEREAEARSLERLINRVIGDGSAHPGDVAETLARIDRLLTEFADLDYVRRREPELRYLKQSLSSEARTPVAADFESAFGAREVELDRAAERVRMSFVFDETARRGPWDPGHWGVAGAGWEADRVSSREQLSYGPRWPRLVLRSPLDLDQPLSVELELQQPRESGPPQLLMVTVAGVHVALRGEASGGSRLLVRSGGADAVEGLLTDLFDHDRGQAAPGLQRGQGHELRIVLTRGRGRAEVWLDGALIGQEDRPRPAGAPGSASVVVRSLEPVRLLRAEIEAGYRSR